MENFPQQNNKKSEKLDLEENKIEKPQIKEGVDFVFEQNTELSSIGNKELYSKYLDTIFPESIFKDIVYHGSSRKFEEFDLSKKVSVVEIMVMVYTLLQRRGGLFNTQEETKITPMQLY